MTVKHSNRIKPVETSLNWNFRNAESKLYALGAHGQDATDLDVAVGHMSRERSLRAERIGDLLRLEPRDVLLDLGSGMGFMARHLAPKVHWLHCADISETYLGECRATVVGLPNVELHLIPYADLSALKPKGISKVLSTLLFIHFNFYDFVYYLQGIRDVINPGGLVFLDFNDGDRFDLTNVNDSFSSHLEQYKDYRGEWVHNCMHMSSLMTLRNLLPQLGFEILSIIPSRTAFTELLLRRCD